MKFIRSDNSLYNGISQQAVELRLPNQVSDAVNAKLSVVFIRPVYVSDILVLYSVAIVCNFKFLYSF